VPATIYVTVWHATIDHCRENPAAFRELVAPIIFLAGFAVPG
jgi:hypothetical protein